MALKITVSAVTIQQAMPKALRWIYTGVGVGSLYNYYVCKIFVSDKISNIMLNFTYFVLFKKIYAN